jgi:hypothetical protein
VEPGASRTPDVDRWFEEADRWKTPTFAYKGNMRFAGLAELEAGRADLEAAVRAWCDWKGG